MEDLKNIVDEVNLIYRCWTQNPDNTEYIYLILTAREILTKTNYILDQKEMSGVP